jgi:A/G-specific adenine glycosylase
MRSGFTDDVIVALRTALLGWYDANARDLPWRGSDDPYAIWISEVMSQQTRIETVMPYFERWMCRFPDVATLASAAEDDVLKQWEGLGYYSRARNLHAAAHAVRERHDGSLPGSYAALRDLPGVGDYTAGAVASIAFGAAEPAVDGNARRVLARLLDEPAPSAARLRAVAAALVSTERPGAFNQALMELGATVCTPRSPSCDACPLASHCVARAAGTQAERPRPKKAAAVPSFDVATLILRSRDDRVLLRRRPARGLLAGLWSFPGRELATGETAAGAVMEMVRAITGREPEAAMLAGCIEHAFSHRRERYVCHVVRCEASSDLSVEGEWVGRDATAFTLPRAQQKIHALAFG